jgi:hypothetical protein
MKHIYMLNGNAILHALTSMPNFISKIYSHVMLFLGFIVLGSDIG